MKSHDKLVRQHKQLSNTALAFLIPFVGMIFMLVIQSINVGNTSSNTILSMLKHDGYLQYFPFFKSLRNAIRNGESLLWSWNIGLGIDYLGLISYYLGSPFNWLGILVPESWLMTYFSLANVCKIAFAGLFFAIMLKKIFGKDDISIALFGTFYATCAWCISYMWNTIWLDTFALLPLVFLGTISLLKERKFILYTISLALSLMTNYYIGFFTCVFTLLIFIIYELCRWGGAKKLAIDFMLMGVFTIISIGMTAIITVPALLQLTTTQSSSDTIIGFLDINKNLIGEDAVEQINSAVTRLMSIVSLSKNDCPTLHNLLSLILSVFAGMTKSATNCFAVSTLHDLSDGGLPNIYCGIFAIILTILSLTSKTTSKKERIAGVILLLFFNISFSYKYLDFVWNAFHVPNAIPYRYSFLYSFVMLLMAYKGWLIRKEFKLWQICVAAVSTLILLVVHLFVYEEDASWLFVLINVALILAYTIVLVLPKIKEQDANILVQKFIKATGGITLCAVVLIELIFNLGNCAFKYESVRVHKYPMYATEIETIMDDMESNNDELQFYRMETGYHQTMNDGALIGYNGISIFSSTANVSVTKFAKKIGLRALTTSNRYTYVSGSPIADLFLNIKYVLAETNKINEQPYLQSIRQEGEVSLMQNQYYLPLGFMVNESLSTLSFEGDEDPFVFQNKLISSAIGEEIRPFQVLSEEKYDDVGSENNSYVEYKIDQSGLFCVYYDLTAGSDIIVCHTSGDTSKRLYFDNVEASAILSTCLVEPGDCVLVQAYNAKKESDRCYIGGAILNQERFEKAYDVLSQSQMELTTFENTVVEGKINCHQDGLLYTSIPYNKNWTVYVDGIETDVSLIGNAMIGINLAQGEHTITMKYKNQSFVVGCTISSCALATLMVICVVMKYRKKRKSLN